MEGGIVSTEVTVGIVVKNCEKTLKIKHWKTQVIGTVSHKVWNKMLEIACELDLNKNGIFDGRSSAINMWVSPEDKPSDWQFKISKCALNYPREYLATLYGIHQNNTNVKLLLTICNYSRRDFAQSLLGESEISFNEYSNQKKLSEQGAEAEWKWAKEKVHWLINLAEKEQVFQTVLCCPFCNRKGFETFNELIECINSHVEVTAVIIGKGIQTSKGLLTENDYTTTVKENI